MTTGGAHGFPVVDVRVECYDGKYHSVDSSDMAFKNAAASGLQRGARPRRRCGARADLVAEGDDPLVVPRRRAGRSHHTTRTGRRHFRRRTRRARSVRAGADSRDHPLCTRPSLADSRTRTLRRHARSRRDPPQQPRQQGEGGATTANHNGGGGSAQRRSRCVDPITRNSRSTHVGSSSLRNLHGPIPPGGREPDAGVGARPRPDRAPRQARLRRGVDRRAPLRRQRDHRLPRDLHRHRRGTHPTHQARHRRHQRRVPQPLHGRRARRVARPPHPRSFHARPRARLAAHRRDHARARSHRDPPAARGRAST